MILGMGIDIIDNRRIKKILEKFGYRFKEKCFSNNEIIRSDKLNNNFNSYAKRYAAKEACAKALGTGLAKGVFWKDIEIKNNKYGKPTLELHNKALIILNKMSKKKCNIEVSLSDENNYSIANVIIYEK